MCRPISADRRCQLRQAGEVNERPLSICQVSVPLAGKHRAARQVVAVGRLLLLALGGGENA